MTNKEPIFDTQQPHEKHIWNNVLRPLFLKNFTLQVALSKLNRHEREIVLEQWSKTPLQKDYYVGCYSDVWRAMTLVSWIDKHVKNPDSIYLEFEDESRYQVFKVWDQGKKIHKWFTNSIRKRSWSIRGNGQRNTDKVDCDLHQILLDIFQSNREQCTLILHNTMIL